MTSSNGSDKNNSKDEEKVIRFPAKSERDKIRSAQEKIWRKEYRAKHPKEPIINLPPATKILVGIFLSVHLADTILLNSIQQYWLFNHFGFVPIYYSGALMQGHIMWEQFAGPLTYMFLHGGWLHVIMNSVMTMAFGAGVERWLGSTRMLKFFFFCSLISLTVHFALNPFSDATVIGASGGINGLFAAVIVMLYRDGKLGYSKYGVFPVIGLWVGITILFGMLGGPGMGNIAWAAHLGGFLGGFILLRYWIKV